MLLVDDDESVVSAIRRLLASDFDVLIARSSPEAMSLLDQNPETAIVLTDQSLPGEQGLDLLAKVQMKNPLAVRALITGHVALNDMVEAINTTRVHRLILKPWENDYFRIQMFEALAIHSTLKEKNELEQLSVTDPVTSLKNHRYFQDSLRIETERALRHTRPLSMAMIDIDRFKLINDRYGHPTGDLVLKAVALRILDQVRTLDVVARYGGEEFAVIMPDADFDGAMKVAERIRSSLESNEFVFPRVGSIRATVSIGVATLPDHATTAQDLISKADESLYRAKGQGRNQTVGAARA